MSIIKKFFFPDRTSSTAFATPEIDPMLLATLESELLVADEDAAVEHFEEALGWIEDQLQREYVRGTIYYLPIALRSKKHAVPDKLSILRYQLDASRNRIEFLESMEELISGWREIYLSEEAMVGHLILSHGKNYGTVWPDQTELIAVHSRLHASPRAV